MLWRELREKSAGLNALMLLAVLALILAGCSRDFPPTPTPTATPLIPATPTAFASAEVVALPTPTPTPLPYPWTDESAVMSGVCFESANDAAGRTFVLHSADELANFFQLADNSRLCRQPVTRHDFDFSGGRILAGIWSRGTGCTARHEVENVRRDDTARTLFIFLKLVTEGDCTYELVRPFWIGLTNVSNYEVQFTVD
jgi:hypothetical protein